MRHKITNFATKNSTELLIDIILNKYIYRGKYHLSKFFITVIKSLLLLNRHQDFENTNLLKSAKKGQIVQLCRSSHSILSKNGAELSNSGFIAVYFANSDPNIRQSLQLTLTINNIFYLTQKLYISLN